MKKTTNIRLMILTLDHAKKELLQQMAPENVRVIQVKNIVEFIQLARLDIADVIMIDRKHPEANFEHLISYVQNLTSQMVTYFNPQLANRVEA